MNQLERTEWIDRYLAGTLSPEEKNEFERLLSAPDKSLYNEMQLQQDIIMAIQERGMREMLQREQERQDEEEAHRRRLWRISSASVLSFAMAAAVALLLVVAPLARQMYSFSDQYAAHLQQSELVRGKQSDPLMQQLLQAQMLIAEGDWREADRIAKDLMKQTKDAVTEEQTDLYQDAQWLHVQCLMHRHRPLQARRLLKRIAADSNNYYHRAAQQILDNELY